MAFLLTEDGPQSGLRYELTGPQVVLGRHPHCDIVIEVGAVSRRHAQIMLVGNDFFLEDLNSRNGTYLNGQLVRQPRPLGEGDRVRICDVSYSFHHVAPAASPPPEPLPTDGSSVTAELVEDDVPMTSSTIMSKLDVTSGHSGVQMAASAEVKLGALLEITQSLGKALSLDEVLPQVLKSLFKIFVQADRGLIVLKGHDGRLVPRWSKLRHEGSEDTMRISRTIVNQVIEAREAILSADAASDERFEMSESIADFRIRSMMCAPLLDTDGKAFGVLQIDTLDQRQRFQQEDLEVLASVASQAAVAIDNAQLHEQALRQQAVERDLKLAHEVQRGFLPIRPPELSAYNFFNYYEPANSVGGDYFDYIAMPDGRLAVIVADVVGHGVAAALLMAKLSTEVRFSLASQLRPATALTQLNATFSNGRMEDRFVTLVMAVLNPDTHEVTIVNAGHMAPLLRRVAGDVEETGEDVVGLPLGVASDTTYDQFVMSLAPGELVALYTDGINEAQNNQGHPYTIDRIRQQVGTTAEDAGSLGRNIIADFRQFIGARPQDDDICLVCFGRTWGDGKLDKEGATAIF